MTKVVVIGGGGHVGLPFSIHMALNGVDVTIYDTNTKLLAEIAQGYYPYSEALGRDYLFEALESNRLKFVSEFSQIPTDVDFVHIMIGTPVDDNGVGVVEPLFGIGAALNAQFNTLKTPVIILRSTVAPGTSALLARKLHRFDVYFCPERVAEGKSFEEIVNLPQIIGVPEVYRVDTRQDVTNHFLNDVQVASFVYLNLYEAEIAKLITNMYRYVNFAFANEVLVLTEKYDVDLNKTIEAANYNYPRMNMPKPGPALGPCLGKDFSFLLGGNPIGGVIAAADKINNYMPDFYVRQLEDWLSDYDDRRVLVMGASFKANSNDTRLSLTPKLVSILENKGYSVDVFDPVAYDEDDYVPVFSDYDGIIIMVNHDCFRHEKIVDGICDSNAVVIDPWRVVT